MHQHRSPANLAISATLHCLTGCAIGEVLGMIVGTALGFSNLAGLALAVVVPIALASDALSIATMEIVDNAIVLLVPGAIAVAGFLFGAVVLDAEALG